MHRDNKQQLSGSHGDTPPPIGLKSLQDEIRRLKLQVADLSLGLKYLADANLELSKDMQEMFTSLRDITYALSGEDEGSPIDDPLASMMLSFFPKKDDDLLN